MRTWLLLLTVTLACGDDSAPLDAGADAPGTDAARDAPPGDAAGADVGGPDAGGPDAGRPDAGDRDGGGIPPHDDGVPEVSCGVVARDQSGLDDAVDAARAGDTICLAAGRWTDTRIAIAADGTAEAPIVIAAEEPGATHLTGASTVQLGGSFAVLTGLVFVDGRTAGGHLIDFRHDGRECHDCRVSNIAVLDLEDEGDTKWVSLRGERNRVDHSAFYGKSNDGALLVVWRPDDGADHHRVDHNLFAERPDLGRNGGETVRIGDSSQHDSSSFTTVEYNYFYRSNGEVEIISNKSSDNFYRDNVFEECEGLLTMRHGQRARVERNVFFVGGVNGGGIRLVDAGHVVINNYVEGCRGTSNVRGGIVLMLADESPAMNGYQLVTDALVAHNTVVDCEQSFVFGGGRSSVAPRDVTLVNNLIDPMDAEFDVVREIESLEASTFGGNLYAEGTLGLADSGGFARADPELVLGAGGIWRPSGGAAAEGAGAPVDVPEDLDRQRRSASPDVGADELAGVPPVLPITRADVGTTYDSEALRR